MVKSTDKTTEYNFDDSAIYNKDRTIRQDVIQNILNDPAGTANTLRIFKVIVCHDNGANYDSLVRDLETVKSHRETPEQVIQFQREDPRTVQTYIDLLKATGQLAVCEDAPMSSLPTPATVATLPIPGKGRG